MSLTGKKALVTGATSGIGKAIALVLAEAGAEVLVHGRDQQRAEEVVQRIIASDGIARAVTADLSAGQDAVRKLTEDITRGTSGVDILVNNAASYVHKGSMTEVDDDQVSTVLATNVGAAVLLSAALVPGMKEHGGGVIINLGSLAGTKGQLPALYGATKAAIHALTKSWALELAPLGIRVNAIAPGATITEDNTDYAPRLVELAERVPNRRPGTAEEVARLALFLAGPDAAHIHGAIIPVDGGMAAI